MNATISREIRALAEAMTTGRSQDCDKMYKSLKKAYKRGKLISNGLFWEIKE